MIFIGHKVLNNEKWVATSLFDYNQPAVIRLQKYSCEALAALHRQKSRLAWTQCAALQRPAAVLQLRGGSLICRRHQAQVLPSRSPSKHLLFSRLRHLHQDLEIVVHSKYLGLRVLSVHGILSKHDLWLRNCEGIVLTFYPSYCFSPRKGSTLEPRSFLSLPLTKGTVFTGQSYAIIQTL